MKTKQCPICIGQEPERTIECPKCEGSKMVATTSDSADDVICPGCGGAGRLVCPTCKGEGTILL
jgi:DnaJ-class molecular chaperone